MELDVNFIGNYKNKHSDDRGHYRDWSDRCLFDSDPKVWITDNWIQFKSSATLGIHNNWSKGNPDFDCWVYHHEEAPDPDNWKGYELKSRVNVNLHACKA